MSTDHATDAGGRHRNVVFGAILFVLVVSVCATLVESACRYLAYRDAAARRNFRFAVYRANPDGGGSFRLKPDLHLAFKVEGVDVHMETNSLGFAGPEVDTADTEHSPRIAFIGDSFAFGHWATDYAHTMVGTFAADPRAARYETLDFGVGAYGLGDEELVLEQEAVKFHPNIVVLCFFSGNDMNDTYFGIDRHDVSDGTAVLRADVVRAMVPNRYWPDWVRPPVPHGRNAAQPSGGAGHDDALPSRLAGFFWRHSAALQAFTVWEDSLRARHRSHGREEWPFIDDVPVDSSFTSFTFWSQRDYPPVADSAAAAVQATLERIRKDVSSMGARLVIVAIPYREQVYLRTLTTGHFDMRRPEAIVRDYAQSHHLTYCDLLPEMRERVRLSKQMLYYAADPHFNDTGHRMAGELVADCLASAHVW